MKNIENKKVTAFLRKNHGFTVLPVRGRSEQRAQCLQIRYSRIFFLVGGTQSRASRTLLVTFSTHANSNRTSRSLGRWYRPQLKIRYEIISWTVWMLGSFGNSEVGFPPVS